MEGRREKEGQAGLYEPVVRDPPLLGSLVQQGAPKALALQSLTLGNPRVSLLMVGLLSLFFLSAAGVTCLGLDCYPHKKREAERVTFWPFETKGSFAIDLHGARTSQRELIGLAKVTQEVGGRGGVRS